MIGFLYAPTLSDKLLFKIKINANGFIVLDKCLSELVEDSLEDFPEWNGEEEKD